MMNHCLIYLLLLHFCTTESFVLEGSPTSYAQFQKWCANLNSSLSLEFQTEEPNGLLLYTDDGGIYDFYELKLVEGALRLRFNLGGGASILTVGRNLHDSQWHKVEIVRSIEETVLHVDNEAERLLSKNSELTFGNQTTNSYVYVGGLPSWYNSKLNLLALPSVFFEPRFKGAIRNVVYCSDDGTTKRQEMTEYKGVRSSQFDICEHNDPCQNGGICISTDSGAICNCKALDYEGEHCEKEKAPSEVTFKGTEILQYDLRGSGGEPIVSTSEVISLYFKTKQASGLLFYTGNGDDFLNLSLRGGGLVVTIRLGSGTIERIVRPGKIRFDDNQWHQVVINRHVREITPSTGFCHLSLTVDGIYSERGSTAGSFALLSSSQIYLGGMELTPSLRGRNNFVGCLRKVEFLADSINLDLIEMAKSNNKLVQHHGSVHYYCQEIDASDPITFTTKESFLVLPTWESKRGGSLNLKFRTNEPNAVLLYNGGTEGNYFALELLDGHIFLLLNLGSDTVKVQATSRKVADGHWHTVSLRKTGKSGRITTDESSVDFTTSGRKLVTIYFFIKLNAIVIVLPTWESKRGGSLNLKFRTNEPNAVLLYNGGTEGNYFALELLDGHIFLLLNLGSDTVKVQATSRKVADGHWHTVSLRKTGKSGRITTDESSVDFTTSGNSNQLDLTGPLYVGGIAPNEKLPSEMWAGNLLYGFVGCIRNLVINSKAIDIASYAKQQDSGSIQPSCHAPPNHCDSRPCLNEGICIPGWNRFTCDCSDTPYIGPICAKAATTVNFDGDQYMKIILGEGFLSEAEDIGLRFRTAQQSGLLFSTHSNKSSTYLIACLELGRIKVLINLGEGDKVINVSATTVNFDGDQYMKIILGEGFLSEAEDIGLRFRTAQQSGLLFSTHSNKSSTYLIACLELGRIKVLINLGEGDKIYFQMTTKFGDKEQIVHHPVTFKSKFTFIGLPQLKAYFIMNLYFQFKTSESNGLILYNKGKGQDFIAVELVNGHLYCIFNMGDGPRKMKSNTRNTLNDNAWHSVTISRLLPNQHTMMVDDVITTLTSSGSNIHLDLDDLLYVGGVRRTMYSTLPQPVRSRYGFEGCLASVDMMGETIDLIHDAIIPSTLVSKGCAELKLIILVGFRKNDDEWHKLWIKRRGLQIEVTIDTETVSHELIDHNSLLDIKNIYLGLQFGEYHSPSKDITGFVGQMQHFYFNGKHYFEMIRNGQMNNFQNSNVNLLKNAIGSETQKQCVQVIDKPDSTAYEFGPDTGIITFLYPSSDEPDTKSDLLALGLITMSKNAVLVRIDSGSGNDYIEVEIVDGCVFVVYNMGTEDHPIGEPRVQVNDGRYHVVRFTRSGPNSTIQVDNHNIRSKNPRGRQLSIFNNHSKIQVGGKKNAIRDSIDRPFQGVITGLVFNGIRILDMASENDPRITIKGDVELLMSLPYNMHQQRSIPTQNEMQQQSSTIYDSDDLVFSGGGSGCWDDEDNCDVTDFGSGDELITPVYIPPTPKTIPTTTTTTPKPTYMVIGPVRTDDMACDDEEDCESENGSGTGEPAVSGPTVVQQVPDVIKFTEAKSSPRPSQVTVYNTGLEEPVERPSIPQKPTFTTTLPIPVESTTRLSIYEVPIPEMPAIGKDQPKPHHKTKRSADNTALVIGIIAGILIIIVFIALIVYSVCRRSLGAYKVDEGKTLQYPPAVSEAPVPPPTFPQTQMNGSVKTATKLAKKKDLKEWYV
ncbi:neurexin-3-like [Centruroides sculpturatus]|uniref:neurexin-3-like n=1 Tax=Centruroides sculpturatus TaxID=218467 RepID=UPI000C6CE83C|nr:neurexin-3-like [Centruroides sculpturatus]